MLLMCMCKPSINNLNIAVTVHFSTITSVLLADAYMTEMHDNAHRVDQLHANVKGYENIRGYHIRHICCEKKNRIEMV